MFPKHTLFPKLVEGKVDESASSSDSEGEEPVDEPEHAVVAAVPSLGLQAEEIRVQQLAVAVIREENEKQQGEQAMASIRDRYYQAFQDAAKLSEAVKAAKTAQLKQELEQVISAAKKAREEALMSRAHVASPASGLSLLSSRRAERSGVVVICLPSYEIVELK